MVDDMKKWIFLLCLLAAQYSFAGQTSIYKFNWLDEDEKVFVIQNKEYVKSKRLGLDFNFLKSDSSAYQSTNGFTGAMAYYFNEEFSLDFTYKHYMNRDNVDYQNLKKAFPTTTMSPLLRKIDSAMLVHLNWIPFYGKINTFNSIYYFDVGMGLGLGQFKTSSNYKTYQTASEAYEQEANSGFDGRVFFKFHFTQNFNFGFEYSYTGLKAIMSADKKETMIYYNDLMIGIGFLL